VLIATLVLVALTTVGALAVMSVRTSLEANGHARFRDVALYAAESGVAAGMEYLRAHADPVTYWTALVKPNNEDPAAPAGILGNGAQPGSDDGVLSDDASAWYEVSILNNVGDPELAIGGDRDARVVLRATGHGPDRTSVTLEVEVEASGSIGLGGRPCPGYGQRGMGEDGAGRNDCLGTIDPGDTTVFSPGG
jgi:hypothetical protein